MCCPTRSRKRRSRARNSPERVSILLKVMSGRTSPGRSGRSSPESAELFLVGHAERELLARRVVGDAGQLAQRLVNVLRPDAHALRLVELEHRRFERHRELLLVGRAEHAVALDALAD